MRSSLLLTAGVLTLTALILPGRPAYAEPVKCKRTITKEYGKYVAAVTKIVDKCKSGVVKSGTPASLAACPTAADQLKIAQAAAKLRGKIAAQCGGQNQSCNAADTGADADDPLVAINWDIGQCMNFEQGTHPDCSTPIADCGDVADCLLCIAGTDTIDGAIEQAVDRLLYDRFNPANFAATTDPQKSRNKCQQTIAKEGVKFLQAKLKILNKCWDAKHSGKPGFGPEPARCPDVDPNPGSGNPPAAPGDSKTVEAIKKVEQKKVDKICKACGGGGDADKDGACDLVPAAPFAALADVITAPFACDDVTVPPNAVHPAGLSCFDPGVTTLQEYVDCIDCVLEFKADCLAAAGVGDGTPDDGIVYPAECNPGVCGNGVQETGEACDGADASACPGQCSSLCTCPGVVHVVFGPPSAAVVHPLGVSVELGGSVDITVGEELQPGVFPSTIPVGQLPPVNVLGLATACTFLVQDPNLPPGIAGSGFINCTAADLTGSGLPVSPEVSTFVDHCVQGPVPPATNACDSAPNAGGGIVDSMSGVFVPDGPSSPTCAAPNAADPYSPHIDVCNGPIVGPTVGTAPYDFGDAYVTLNVALDIRNGVNDPCDPPVSPGTVPVRISFTTGTARAGIMDTTATAGMTVAAETQGAPVDCRRFLNGDPTGATLTGAFAALDAPVSFLTLDTVATVTFVAQ